MPFSFASSDPSPRELASPARRFRYRLLLVSPLLAILPLAAYAVALFLGVQAARESDMRGDLQRAAIGLAAAVEAELRAGRSALEALAGSFTLETGDLDAFREEARRVLAREPGWYTVALLDADRQLLNLRYPPEAPLPAASELPVGPVLQTGRPSPGGLRDGRITLRVPVRIDGAVRYALVAVLEPAALAEALEQSGPHPGWSALLFDAEGRLIASSSGTAARAEALRPALAHPGEALAIEDDWLAFTQPVGETRWTVAVAMRSGSFARTAGSWLIAAAGLSAFVAALGIGVSTIGRQRRAEAERLRRETEERARLMEQERRRADLLATVSHELRVPLTGLLGYTDLLAQTPLPPTAKAWVEQQRRAGQTLLALIGDVLDFARLEEGAIGLEDTDIDLLELLEDSAGLMRSLAQQKGISLVVTADRGLPRWVRGDPLRLRQVLTNLLGNAVKFTDFGQVVLSARLTARPERLELAVSDTGAGIPPEQLQVIFDRFEQGSADTARRFGGSGLGLAICRRLVTAMGGSITAESRPGKGSRFVLHIPFRPGAAPRSVARPGALRILVAEDVPACRLLTETVLRRAGHEVTTAEDGARALAAMHAASFDLVVLDLHMPGLDGFGVAAALRSMPGEQGRLPLIALTGDSPEEVEMRCRQAGFDAVLRKPFETRRLLGLIEALAGRPAEDGTKRVGERLRVV